MKTLSWHLRQRSTPGRIGVYVALTGTAALLGWAMDIGTTTATLFAATALVAVDVAIWLRNNPTRKQIERRRMRNAERDTRSDS